MSKCPLCYGNVNQNSCEACGLSLSESEMTKLKADTYDSIIGHLLESGKDDRRREQARTKIALRNIKKWAKGNLPLK